MQYMLYIITINANNKDLMKVILHTMKLNHSEYQLNVSLPNPY